MTVQASSALLVASMVDLPPSSTVWISSVIHSTWVSIPGGRLLKALFGPKTMKRLGNPETATPR